MIIKLSELCKLLRQFGNRGSNVFILVKNMNINSFKRVNAATSVLSRDIDVQFDKTIYRYESWSSNYCYYVIVITEDDLQEELVELHYGGW